MSVFKVPVSYEEYGIVEVEAEDKQDLENKLQDESFVSQMKFPNKTEYITGSYQIDFAGLDSLNR